VLTHTPIEIAVAAMYFSLQMHQLNTQMPGGLRWYANWNVNEERIQGVVQAVLEMYEEVAYQAAPVQTAPVGLISAPSITVPGPDLRRTPQPQPTPTPQQIATQKAKMMVANAKTQQAAVVPGLQPAAHMPQQLHTQSRAVAQPNMFIPASSAKGQRSIEQKPARQAVEHHSHSGSLSSGQHVAAASKAAPTAKVARSISAGNSNQPTQTFANELIETERF